MTDGLDILAQTIFTGNLVLVQGLGLYALIRYTKDVSGALRAGLNTCAGMLVGAALLWLLGDLAPTSPAPQVGFYLVIGLVSAMVAPCLTGRRASQEHHVVDTALIGMLLLMGRDGIAGVHNLWVVLGGGLGYAVILVVMATIRQRLELSPIPKALKGIPIILITAGLIAIALLGFRF